MVQLIIGILGQRNNDMTVQQIDIEELQPLIILGNNLQDQGVNNVVFQRDIALQLIDVLFGLGYPILGGDIYLRHNDRFQLSYDNWYCDRDNDETDDEYLLRSSLAAKAYLEDFLDSTNSYCALVLGARLKT